MNPVEIKAAVRKRDGLCCTECGMTNEQHIDRYGRSLEVHRITPGSRYSMRGCVTLCKPCHATKPKRPVGCLPYIRIYKSQATIIRRVAGSRGISTQEFLEPLLDKIILLASKRSPKPEGGAE